MVYVQLRIRPRKWDVQNSLEFWDTNRSRNLGQTTRPSDYQQQQKKKRICRIVDFAVQADHKVKLKKSEKRDKYQDLSRELKKQNKKQTIEHENNSNTNYDWRTKYGHQKIGEGTGEHGNKRTRRHPQYYNIVEIC